MKYRMDDENNSDMIFLRRDADENPEMYQQMSFPPIWDDLFDDSKQAVAPMHTLGPCAIKNTQQLLFQFLKLRNKQAPMLENMNVQFDIVSDMKLDWCKVFPVETSKFGSWVSENWISLGRIMKWIYSSIESVAPDFTFIFPTSPVETWSNKQNEGWLRYYGLSSQGNQLEKRQQVLDNYNSDKLESPEERSGSIQNIEFLLSSISSMLSLIMSKKQQVNYVSEIDRHIRIFLHHINLLDGIINRSISKPYLESSYSYLALLQFPTMIKKYGSV